MSDKDNSVNYLQHHIGESFADLMGEQTIDEVSWVDNKAKDGQIEIRAFASFVDSNIIALFPNFDPTGHYPNN